MMYIHNMVMEDYNNSFELVTYDVGQ